MTAHAITVAPGDTLELTLTGMSEPTPRGGPRWTRWQVVCNIMREFDQATGCKTTVKSDCWPSGRPR